MEKEEKYFKAYLGLSLVPGVGPATLRRLLISFDSPEAVLNANDTLLQKVPGVGPKISRSILDFDIEKGIEFTLNKADEMGAQIIIYDDARYPEILKQIPVPPVILYVLGDIAKLPPNNIAVVGTRLISEYGRKATQNIVTGLVSVGYGIVSGLARGVDTQAHKSAVQANGYTAAILGCGIDVIYPPENRKVYAKIAESGAVVSEFPFGTKPAAGNFPQRNRIISGLAQGTLVVEAPLKSGTMITAAHALQQNRDLFAVPGSIFAEGAKGTNTLISRGAYVVTSAKSIIDVIEPGRQSQSEGPRISDKPPQNIEISDEEKEILKALGDERIQIDELGLILDMEMARLSRLLTVMEIKGVVARYPGKFFEKASF